MIYKYLQYKIFILFKYILFILGLFVLLFLVFIKESFAYTATAPTSVCTNCTETVNNTTPGLNLNGLSSDNAAAGYQIHTQYINSNFIKGPIENAQYNITGSSFTGYSNGHNWGPIYNYWLDSSYYNSCSTYYLWNIGYTSNHSSPFCNRYKFKIASQIAPCRYDIIFSTLSFMLVLYYTDPYNIELFPDITSVLACSTWYTH